MNVTRKEQRIIQRALNAWQASGELTPADSQRLAQPVMWGDEEAQFVIMLTLNKHSAGDQHMRIFSRLARRIMHAEFRQALVSAQSREDIAQLLRRELEL